MLCPLCARIISAFNNVDPERFTKASQFDAGATTSVELNFSNGDFSARDVTHCESSPRRKSLALSLVENFARRTQLHSQVITSANAFQSKVVAYLIEKHKLERELENGYEIFEKDDVVTAIQKAD